LASGWCVAGCTTLYSRASASDTELDAYAGGGSGQYLSPDQARPKGNTLLVKAKALLWCAYEYGKLQWSTEAYCSCSALQMEYGRVLLL
jgi:hypothetical protein